MFPDEDYYLSAIVYSLAVDSEDQMFLFFLIPSLFCLLFGWFAYSAYCFSMATKKQKIFGIFLVVILVISLIAVAVFVRSMANEQNETSWPKKSGFKSILLWNAPDRKEASTFGRGHDAFIQQGCEVSRCEIVTSPWQRPLETYDAILINLNDFYWLKERKLPQLYYP